MDEKRHNIFLKLAEMGVVCYIAWNAFTCAPAKAINISLNSDGLNIQSEYYEQ